MPACPRKYMQHGTAHMFNLIGNLFVCSIGAAGAAKIGTQGVPFQPTQLQKDSMTGKMMKSQVISAMPAHKNKSLEELRFEDYYQAPAAPGMEAPAPMGSPGMLGYGG